ncbi:hypothetical protein ASG66_17540 [Bacillus sp. Leaf406]|nr:hypothetical protein ASG66_17540 [Bacillus sp. Leaf406]
MEERALWLRALFVLGWRERVSSFIYGASFIEIEMEGVERWVTFVPLRPSAFRGEWVELPRACRISPALYSLRSRPAFAALHFLVEKG